MSSLITFLKGVGKGSPDNTERKWRSFLNAAKNTKDNNRDTISFSSAYVQKTSPKAA
jgi:hypothetical protein